MPLLTCRNGQPPSSTLTIRRWYSGFKASSVCAGTQFHPITQSNMRHINYNHLFYFWNVADAGSIAAASKRLYLTPQTISTQIKLLEETTGTALFQKSGRRLVLTDQGIVVKRFADDIFSLGTELSSFMRGEDKQIPKDIKVGIVETLPKIAVVKFLQPAFDANVLVSCTEGSLQTLFAQLKKHEIDLILSDQSMSISETNSVHIHALGQSELAFFAAKPLLDKYSNRLPHELSNAPVIFPTEASPLRRAGDDWFIQQGITPNIIAECSDSGLIKAMAAAARGLFIAPVNVRADIEMATNCHFTTLLENFHERYFAITLDKKIEHPIVNDIVDSARKSLELE